jgi:hypothetical protein
MFLHCCHTLSKINQFKCDYLKKTISGSNKIIADFSSSSNWQYTVKNLFTAVVKYINTVKK